MLSFSLVGDRREWEQLLATLDFRQIVESKHSDENFESSFYSGGKIFPINSIKWANWVQGVNV